MRCFVCGRTETESHHVYGASNRNVSEKYGFVERLCPVHHRGQPDGVHGGNHELDLKLKRKHQLIYELELMSDGISQEEARETFRRIIGKSYL